MIAAMVILAVGFILVSLLLEYATVTKLTDLEKRTNSLEHRIAAVQNRVGVLERRSAETPSAAKSMSSNDAKGDTNLFYARQQQHLKQMLIVAQDEVARLHARNEELQTRLDGAEELQEALIKRQGRPE